MRTCDVIIYSCGRTLKLTEITDNLFCTISHTLHYLNIKSLLENSWFNASKYLLIHSESDVEINNKELNSLMENTLSNGNQKILVISDWIRNQLTIPQSMSHEVVGNNMTEIKFGYVSRVLLCENVESMLKNVNVIQKLWNLEIIKNDDLKHTDVFGLTRTNKELTEFINQLKLTSSNDNKTEFQYDQSSLLVDNQHKICIECCCSRILSNSQVENDYVTSFCCCNQTNKSLLNSFDSIGYFSNLVTNRIGRHVIYCEILDSSYVMMNKLIELGNYDTSKVIISRRQMNGVGRGNNKWLSPIGCSMFTVMFSLPFGSRLINSLPIVQHVMAVSILEALNILCGLKDGKLVIKWPNDVYINGIGKLAGILSRCTSFSDSIYCVMGCGINISNRKPTICLYDLLDTIICASKTYPSLDAVIGTILTRLESNIDMIQTQFNGIELFKKKYHHYWMHNNKPVEFIKGDLKGEGRIKGIDNYGFLLVEQHNGEEIALHPDGNSFDLMKNLIHPSVK